MNTLKIGSATMFSLNISCLFQVICTAVLLAGTVVGLPWPADNVVCTKVSYRENIVSVQVSEPYTRQVTENTTKPCGLSKLYITMYQRTGRKLPAECDPDVEPIYIIQNVIKTFYRYSARTQTQRGNAYCKSENTKCINGYVSSEDDSGCEVKTTPQIAPASTSPSTTTHPIVPSTRAPKTTSSHPGSGAPPTWAPPVNTTMGSNTPPTKAPLVNTRDTATPGGDTPPTKAPSVNTRDTATPGRDTPPTKAPSVNTRDTATPAFSCGTKVPLDFSLKWPALNVVCAKVEYTSKTFTRSVLRPQRQSYRTTSVKPCELSPLNIRMYVKVGRELPAECDPDAAPIKVTRISFRTVAAYAVESYRDLPKPHCAVGNMYCRPGTVYIRDQCVDLDTTTTTQRMRTTTLRSPSNGGALFDWIRNQVNIIG